MLNPGREQLGRGAADFKKLAISFGLFVLIGFAGFGGALAFVRVTRIHLLFEAGPLSLFPRTMLCVAICWVLLGAVVAGLASGKIHRNNWVPWAAFLVYAFVYLNFVRERFSYGDVDDYVEAAINIRDGVPFHLRYIYPPLWATLLQPFLRLGVRHLPFVILGANLISTLAFFELARRTVMRYGVGGTDAAVLLLLMTVVNVPLLRTLGYMQINIHIANLICGCALLYPRRTVWSALSLAVGAHLKVAPVVLALPFLAVRDRTWVLSFAAWVAAIFGVTSLLNGPQRYLEFVHNVLGLHPEGASLRDNAVDSIVINTLMFVNAGRRFAFVPIILIKVCLLGWLVSIASNAASHRTFAAEEGTGAKVLNAFVVLPFLMLLVAPIIWEHHYVILIVPFAVMATRLSTRWEWIEFIAAFVLVFTIPTFDLYPFSYHRLLGLLVAVALLGQLCRREGMRGGPAFRIFVGPTDAPTP